MTDPIRDFIEREGFLVLDGGLATELEALGCDLDDPLWSARALIEAPEAIRTAHRRFLEAGADCIATATYQATFEGFASRGLDAAATTRLLRDSVDLAISARADFLGGSVAPDPDDLPPAGQPPASRPPPLVAASIGPYGAYLADGSEYTGDYGLSAAELYDFHAPRWEVLAETEADVLACETTPSVEETRAYCRLAAVSHRPTWISFQCRDGARLADGAPFETAVALCEAEPHVVAIGVNCVDPRLVAPLIHAARRATGKPILVYPNSGEEWDAEAKRWTGPATPLDWARSAAEWRREGADGVGGCCRVGPAEIAAIRADAVR
ncbi:homocysteine S-methyltransferase [Candidatus Palauibacter polyketidifaciens]|uniref:homocysteine S-methyltransferase n=1 Tax=Candidatus Palauibacter polyketidifaciens TaxID=3056740 RepID=UPI00139EAA0E|nr:homocysteine S-methyltransferase [Candidatus Palauibacter polyketidifaciens]MDE2719839.1 homocysteine S-methyltransferase [Candidatus Palauibacter polyketidifaciens]MYE33339.1 homocysteine S-methyltransferase [Gemmatimonadales bacterium]